MIYGYARVSTAEQNEARQLIALKAAGVKDALILVDKASGKDFLRPKYQALRARLKKGDLLIVQSLDRFGRSYDDIIDEWRYLVKTVGVDVKVLDMPLLDTRQGEGLIGRFVGDIVLQILSFVAEMERRKIKERQAQGIAAAKAREVRFGRPPVERPANLGELIRLYTSHRLSLREAAGDAGMSVSTFYREATRYGEGVRRTARSRVQVKVNTAAVESAEPRAPAKGERPSVAWVMSLPATERWQYAKNWTAAERREAINIEKTRGGL